MKIIYPITLAVINLLAIFNVESQVINITPKIIIGGIGQVLTISGSGFGNTQGNNFVSFLQESSNYMDSIQGQSLKYNSWTDTKIEVEMPTAFSGKIKVNIGGVEKISNDTLKVKSNLGYRNVNPLNYDYLNNMNSRGGYTWYIHRTYWNNPLAKAAIEDVFKELRCKTGVNYILANTPSDATFKLGDNTNLIAPDSILGAAGYTDRMWSSCIIGAITFYKTSDMDLRMSAKQNWYFGTGKVPNGQAKFRYVLVHELGHSLGLGHVNELGQTMFPSVTLLPSNNWSERDSITMEEKTAITYFINQSQNFTFNGCGITPLSKIFDCNDVYGLGSGIETTENRLDEINIYPNPTDGIFIIDRFLGSIEIYNIQGKIIYSSSQINPSNHTIDISNQPQGIYFIKMNDGEKYYSRKIIIQ